MIRQLAEFVVRTHMKLILKDDERIIIVLRATKLVLFWPFLAGAVLIFLPVFLFIPLVAFGLSGVIIFWSSIAIGLLYFLTKLWFWLHNAVHVTNKRIVDVHQKKLFEVIVSEVPFYEIDDISFRRKGLWQNMLNYGTITLNLKNSRVSLEIKKIKKPAVIQILLQDLKNVSRAPGA